MQQLVGLDGRPVSTEQVNYGAKADVYYRRATCEEVGCVWQRSGWATTVDTTTELGQMQAAFIRQDKTRAHTELTGAAWNERGRALALERGEQFDDVPAGAVVFVFAPGTECFQRAEHVTTEAVSSRFFVRDHFGGLIREHSGIDPFVDDFRTHSEPQFDVLRERMGEING